MTTKPQWQLDRLKPNRMDPIRESGFRMGQSRKDKDSWMDRMASRYTIVEVRCSTDPQPENEPLHIYKRHQSETDAWNAVIDHMQYMRRSGVLAAGKWTISQPGTNRKHSFEVE